MAARPRAGLNRPVDHDALTLPTLLARAVRDFGDHTYVATPTDRATVAEIEQASAVAARRLLMLGVGKGTRVGLLFPNGTAWLRWWLAAARIGAVAVPLSTFYRPAELATVVRLADVAVLVAPQRVLDTDADTTAARLESTFPDLVGQHPNGLALVRAPYLRRILLEGSDLPSWAAPSDGPGLAGDLLAAAEAEVTPADLAMMIYTSGSTADPKGVLHTHGTLVRQTSTWPAAVRALSDTTAAPVILCAMPFFWIGGVLAATGALHGPATLLALPRLDAAAALDLIEAHGATAVVGWPAFTLRLREHPSFAGRDLSRAPMLRDGPVDLAMVDVPDGYPVHRSMSETAGGFAFTETAVVDEAGHPVPDGEVGELLVRGVGVMAGYNKRERNDTFDADGWYHTGDRVYRRAGDPRLFYVGRTGDLVKVAGANVSPLEVEAALDAVPGVAQSVVFGLDDPDRGEEVAAVLVPAAGGLDIAAVDARVRETLSSYKVPALWFTVGEVPTLPSGKVDRRALRAWASVNSAAAERVR
jgi:acyl-CoA synthetase (AMP-forming)/AMP-acid ligase II